MIYLSANEEEMIRRIVAELAGNTKPVLDRAQAIKYTNHYSDTAFDRWRKKMNVTACSQGRYARGHLDRAMQREAMTRRTRKIREVPPPPPAADAPAAKTHAA
jgi:hypothetical protein